MAMWFNQLQILATWGIVSRNRFILFKNREWTHRPTQKHNIEQEGLAVASIARDDPSTLPDDLFPRAH